LASIDEWNNYFDLLNSAGVLKATDADMLAIMCNDIKDYKRYSLKIKAQGEIVKGKPSHFIKLKNDARKRILEISPLFGIDPVNRQKIVVEAEKGKSFFYSIFLNHQNDAGRLALPMRKLVFRQKLPFYHNLIHAPAH
jgi:P27 family predicted phage terminase small subunit